jgi:hypothetical protein
MKTGRLTTMTTTPQGPGKPAPKTESSDWGKYEAYVKQKKAYDTDKTEYDARWKRSNEMSRGSVSPYNFEAAPAEVKPPELTGKLPIRKAEISTSGNFAKGKIAGEKSEQGNFNNPKVSVKGGKRITPGSVVKTANLRGAKPQVDTKNKPFSGYNKESKRFKAYAQDSALGTDFSKMTSGEIKNYRNVRKEDRQMDRKSGADVAMKAQRIASNTMDIRQSRKAEKFAKGIEKGGNAIKHFTDKNYGGNIVKDYKESAQNAANRNTMAEKIKRAGAKAAGFNGQMPL